MAEYKCKCGKPATKRIYTDSELSEFIHVCEECEIGVKEDIENWEDMKYRQGRSKEKYLSNLKTMEFVLVVSIAFLAAALLIQMLIK